MVRRRRDPLRVHLGFETSFRLRRARPGKHFFHAASVRSHQHSNHPVRRIGDPRRPDERRLVFVRTCFYPAQSAAIEALLDALQKLAPAATISPAELRTHNNPEAEFGFENPQLSLVVETGGQRRELLVGNKTAPGDQVFLRVVGVDGAFVTDAGWLKFIPRSADDWRSTALVDAGQSDFDFIVLTNGAKVIELHRDATNRLWRMTRPLQARADSDRIIDALEQLRSASVARFVTDDPNADLSAFGLQPADLDLWLGRGTNFYAAIHAGKSAANDASQFLRDAKAGTRFSRRRRTRSRRGMER